MSLLHVKRQETTCGEFSVTLVVSARHKRALSNKTTDKSKVIKRMNQERVYLCAQLHGMKKAIRPAHLL